MPRYDLDAFLIEVELLIDWYLPRLDIKLADAKRDAYVELWRDALLAGRSTTPPTWVLRDYHSPNLLWLPERDGVARVGLLDFQDAVMGPAAYDLASLLQDARVDVPETMEIALLSRYTRARRAADAGFRRADLRAGLRHARRAARLQDPRHLRPPRPPRRQAAIFASHAAGMGLFAAFAGASGAGAARRLVSRQRAGAEIDLTRMTPTDTHARAMVLVGRPGHAHAPAHRHACRSRWSRSAASR